jgi:hypothetical protein
MRGTGSGHSTSTLSDNRRSARVRRHSDLRLTRAYGSLSRAAVYRTSSRSIRQVNAMVGCARAVDRARKLHLICRHLRQSNESGSAQPHRCALKERLLGELICNASQGFADLTARQGYVVVPTDLLLNPGHWQHVTSHPTRFRGAQPNRQRCGQHRPTIDDDVEQHVMSARRPADRSPAAKVDQDRGSYLVRYTRY